MLTILIYSFIVVQSWSYKPIETDCSLIKVEVLTTATTLGLQNGAIEVIVSGGDGDLKYFFCDESGKVLNEYQITRNAIGNLKRGNYHCIVSTGSCTKKVKTSVS